jgi:hypothetical protein
MKDRCTTRCSAWFEDFCSSAIEPASEPNHHRDR